MTALVVTLGVVALGGLATTCFRWWLAYQSAQREADRQTTLAVARAAPADVAALRAEVFELKERFQRQTMR